LPKRVLDTGALSDDQIKEWSKKLRLLDWLNHYWEDEKIPHTFQVE